MTLADVRDYIASLNLADHVYMAKLPDKQDRSIGVYNSKHQYPHKVAIGGPALESYGTRYITLLVHWNKSPRETEKAATDLFEAIRSTREAKINDAIQKGDGANLAFIQIDSMPEYKLCLLKKDVQTNDDEIYNKIFGPFLLKANSK